MDNHTLAAVIALSKKYANEITSDISDDIAQNVTNWLDNHVDPETGYVIDDTLTIQGAAADAKAVGDADAELKNQIDEQLTIVDDVFINKTRGYTEASVTYKSTDFIPVLGDIFLLTFNNTENNAGYAFYDSEKAFISGSGIYSISGTKTKITPPNGASYFRTSCLATRISDLRVEHNITDNITDLIDINTGNAVAYLNGFIKNNTGTIGAFTEAETNKSALIPVQAGEVYSIYGTGAAAGRLWSTHLIDKTTSRIADAYATAITDPVEITIQPNEKYLVFNSVINANRRGVFPKIGSMTAYQTRQIILDIENRIETPDVLTIKNNLQTDGVWNLKNCKIYSNNTASDSNYGKNGVRYDFALTHKSFRLYFEFKFTEPIPYNVGDSTTTTKLVNAFSNHVACGINSSYSYINDMRVLRACGPVLISGANSSNNLLLHMRYENMKGQDALSVKYDGTPDSTTSASIRFENSETVVVVNGVQTNIPCTTSTTILELVASLNDVDGIVAEALLPTNHTYGELMPVVAKVQNGGAISLICTGTISGTTYYDNPEVYIPLALDTKWHSLEVYYDQNKQNVYAAYDGLTLTTAVGNVTKNDIISIGNDGAPISLRNLEIDYGHFGDAEIVSNRTDPSIIEQYPPADVIISNHNPRLLIYEGHGIDVQTDEKTPTESGMSCSVERLNILFSEAEKNGYVPVSWREIIDWKINGKPLPKRCYTIMFDDWRFANYVDHKKRAPFVKYGVHPGLAVITDNHSIDGTVEIDGITYNVRDVVNMTERAGWYPSTHTKNHRNITDSKPSESGALFNQDIQAADVYGIHSDVITYPYGSISGRYIPVLEHSDFVLGLVIFSREYNCRATNNFYLGRVELGNRVPIATVLYPLV